MDIGKRKDSRVIPTNQAEEAKLVGILSVKWQLI